MWRLSPLSLSSSCPRRCSSLRFLSSSSPLLNDKNYTSTLLLPKTDFAQNHKLENEKKLLEKITTSLYRQQRKEREEAPEFVLHDGPPFANGVPHVGHALNKILKDITNRYHLLQGYKLHYVPGWDCHGLPLEHKVSQGKPVTGLSTQEDIIDIRLKARELASSSLLSQAKEFRSWGVVADWGTNDSTDEVDVSKAQFYRTMVPEYEAAQLDLFWNMYKQGLIYQSERPVYWSPVSQTALAEAELEYSEDHKSLSAYVAYDICSPSQSLSKALSSLPSRPLRVCCWTTTPWTLPASRAVCIRDDITYAIVKFTKIESEEESSLLDCEDYYYLFAESLVGEFEGVVGGVKGEVVGRVEGGELVGSEVLHPIYTGEGGEGGGEKKVLPLLSGDHVHVQSGTGLVHTAPGHGFDDYLVCKNASIAPFCSVDNQGCLIDEIGIPSLAGKDILSEETNQSVIDLLKQNGRLMHSHLYVHKYPYDWRSKTPVVIRATTQWFANVDQIKENARECLREVGSVPPNATTQLGQVVQSRNEWCISRQRVWGLPLPIFYEPDTLNPVINEEIMEYVRNLIKEKGSDYWWSSETDNLLPESYRGKGLIKGKDTMDVWLDSGSSWTSVLGQNGIEKAHVYIEGVDQHRGWFQSSLLTSVASRNEAPYENLICHSFVVDEKGYKMSKSLGNVVAPTTIINGGPLFQEVEEEEEKQVTQNEGEDKKKKKKKKKVKKSGGGEPVPALGVDVMRLFFASADFTNDIAVSRDSLIKSQKLLKKIRNAIKFGLGNITNSSSDDAPYELLAIDKLMLHELNVFQRTLDHHYSSFKFSRAIQTTTTFCTDFSAFYCTAVKDRLYCHPENHPARQGAIKVLKEAVEVITRGIAPILCFTAEEAAQHFMEKSDENASLFLTKPTNFHSSFYSPDLEAKWGVVKSIRRQVLQTIEQARMSEDKIFTSSPQTDVEMNVSSPLVFELLQHIGEEDLAAVFDVATVSLILDKQEGQEKEEGVYQGEWTVESNGGTTHLPCVDSSSPLSGVASLASLEEGIGGGAEEVIEWSKEIEGIREGDGGVVRYKVRKAKGSKCARCWRFICGEGMDVCPRCAGLI